MAQRKPKADGWHRFTLPQAKRYIKELKAEYSGKSWTGLGACAESMTELATEQREELVALRAEIAKLHDELRVLRATHPEHEDRR